MIGSHRFGVSTQLECSSPLGMPTRLGNASEEICAIIAFYNCFSDWQGI